MGGLFKKGGGVPLTPAQQQLQQQAIEQAQTISGTWMPVQRYFADQVQRDAPGLKEMGRGLAAASGRAAGAGATLQGLAGDRGAGAAAGSGRFLADLGGGLDRTAMQTASGLTAATGAAEHHYVQGLQQILGMAQRDQGIATHGLETAANEQAQEAGALAAAQTANAQGAGQLIGLAAAM